MRRSPLNSRAQRLGTIGAVVLLHVVLLGLFLTAGSDASALKPQSPSLSLIDVAVAEATPQSAPPPPPALPSKVALAQSPPEPPSTAPSPTAAAAPGGGCATLASVSAAINGDALATTGIRSAPQDLQSMSGAVVVWNAGWSSGARGPDEPLQAVRRVIEATLRTIDSACLEEQVAGPRLVAIPIGDRSMYVVLGSGMWTWRQMLDDPATIDQPQDVERKPRSWIDWY